MNRRMLMKFELRVLLQYIAYHILQERFSSYTVHRIQFSAGALQFLYSSLAIIFYRSASVPVQFIGYNFLQERFRSCTVHWL
jgi:hypothetical protein